MPRKKTADAPPRAAKPPEADKREPAHTASADAMLLTLTVAALTPIIESLTAFSAASAQRMQQAMANEAQTQAASLTTTAAAVNAMLR